ncbi:hypothetical protein V5F23_09895 [Pseudomonas sp. WP18]|uniref:3-isopropylmalate dehydratase n=1 Tax=Pseudomonas brassicacearum TaxID=930166 RepID=A0A423GDF7_9PSED|nr:hypothetical protein [Pseudomonas brassicacearum]ROM84887.1 hypothetical protein BK652_09915 [Pseudomonas brassicacearum]
MRILIAAIAVALLAGCSTSAVSPSEAKPVPKDRLLSFTVQPKEPYGTVVVTRDTGFMGGGCFVAVHVDGKLAARIDTGEVARFYLPVGDHLVGMGIDKQGGGMCSWTDMLKEQSAILKEGQVKRFRIGGDSQTGLDIRPSSL